MTKKVKLSAEERAQLVLRFLSKEDTAGNLAPRAGISADARIPQYVCSAEKELAGGKEGYKFAEAHVAPGRHICRGRCTQRTRLSSSKWFAC